jgi:hypothetical protein
MRDLKIRALSGGEQHGYSLSQQVATSLTVRSALREGDSVSDLLGVTISNLFGSHPVIFRGKSLCVAQHREFLI